MSIDDLVVATPTQKDIDVLELVRALLWIKPALENLHDEVNKLLDGRSPITGQPGLSPDDWKMFLGDLRRHSEAVKLAAITLENGAKVR